MQVTESGSVRVDLVGGTIDLEPLNVIIPKVVTLNVATSLKAEVSLKRNQFEVININSKDYGKNYSFPLKDLSEERLFFTDEFKEMTFVLQIIRSFDLNFGLDVILTSGAPAGSGLGGSSAMGITLYKALCRIVNKKIDIEEAVRFVKTIEGRILNKGMPGYQDYYPALTGGVLALKGTPLGIKCEQLYSQKLKSFLEDHITLVYSGISRNSGINNWDVYKAFFDKDENVVSALGEIAKISDKTYREIKKDNFSELINLISKEGEIREKLAPGIVPVEVSNLFSSLKSKGLVKGLKMCGAGGGGCFILVHESKTKNELLDFLKNAQYKILDFKIDSPLN